MTEYGIRSNNWAAPAVVSINATYPPLTFFAIWAVPLGLNREELQLLNSDVFL